MRITKHVPSRVVDDKGELTDTYQQYFDNLENQINQNLSTNGYVIPQNTTQDIKTIAASNTNNGVTLVVDSTTGQLKAIVNGVVKTVTLT
jgi:hypothetical protein